MTKFLVPVVLIMAVILSMKSAGVFGPQVYTPPPAHPSPLSSENNWPMFRMNPEHTGGSGQVDVKNLTLLWKYEVSGELVLGDPVISDGKVFVTKDRSVYCLDAASGRLVWKHRPWRLTF